MDFDFDGDEFDFDRAPKAGKNKATKKGEKRSFGQRSQNASHAATSSQSSNSTTSSSKANSKDESKSPSSSSSSSFRSTIRPTETTNARRARRRIRRRPSNDDMEDDLESVRSHSSDTTDQSYSVASMRSNSRPELSVRRGTGAFAVQDAGTYQMVHDEVTYLCSTILSKTTLPSKAIDSAMELATLLSSRKTRSMLWQDRNDNEKRNDHDSNKDEYKSKQMPAPIPKAWSSILDVLALAATTTSTVCGSFENQCPSSSSSISSNNSARPGQKARTKSARRKEKALLGASQTNSHSSADQKLNADMRTVLTCILYYISWDCTLSREHSIAVTGAVEKPHVARRIRMAILERGTVLMSVTKLMVPSQQTSATNNTAPARRWIPFPAKIVPISTSSVSPLKTRSKRSLLSTEAKPETNKSNGISTTLPAGDPTAMGRRKRKNRKKHSQVDTDRMPPPAPRDELSFADSSTKAHDDGSSVLSEPSVLSTRLGQKIASLCAKVRIESSCSSSESLNLQKTTATTSYGIQGDRPWLTIVCLEALSRILTGKEMDGKTSCLEGADANHDGNDDSDKEGDDSENEPANENVVMVTNRLVGKSGMIPALSHAISQSMAVATKIVFGYDSSQNGKDECWVYCYDRLKLLASIIDEACFFSDRNRMSFCENDPFDFADQKKGLIFHVIMFLHHCCHCDLNQPDPKRSETMTLALRTLTSLTHDNPLAAKQMKDFIDCDAGFSSLGNTNQSIQGLQVLANLAFQLEESSSANTAKKTAFKNTKRASDHDMHRYDGTVFCLTTLANVIEDSDSGRILMEMEFQSKSGKSVSWLKWLCQWVVKQTENFRQDILSIGKDKKNSNVGQGMSHEEDEKLLAAGNACVVLACLITKSDGDDPESSMYIRKLIEKQMPPNTDGSSSGLTMVVNTMKAHCNYYAMSMGQMSLAVVAPVKKLIAELEYILNTVD